MFFHRFVRQPSQKRVPSAGPIHHERVRIQRPDFRLRVVVDQRQVDRIVLRAVGRNLNDCRCELLREVNI